MIKTKHVWKEIVKPEDVEKSEDNKFIWVAIYKAIYMALRILLDIRHSVLNAPIIPKKPKKVVKFEVKKVQNDNSVIKDKDNIKAEDYPKEKETKADAEKPKE